MGHHLRPLVNCTFTLGQTSCSILRTIDPATHRDCGTREVLCIFDVSAESYCTAESKAQAFTPEDSPFEPAKPFPPDTRFLRTSLRPATSIIRASAPRMTARVTMAPMTPPTAVEMPLPFPLPLFSLDEDEEEPAADDEEEVPDAGAHTPVELPQALHQSL